MHNIKSQYIEKMNDDNISDNEKSDILLSALSEIDDIDWLESFYIQYAQSDNQTIAKLALICIGHLARIHQYINQQKVLPFLNNIKNDNHQFAGIIDDVLDDIALFSK